VNRFWGGFWGGFFEGGRGTGFFGIKDESLWTLGLGTGEGVSWFGSLTGWSWIWSFDWFVVELLSAWDSPPSFFGISKLSVVFSLLRILGIGGVSFLTGIGSSFFSPFLK